MSGTSSVAGGARSEARARARAGGEALQEGEVQPGGEVEDVVHEHLAC